MQYFDLIRFLSRKLNILSGHVCELYLFSVFPLLYRDRAILFYVEYRAVLSISRIIT